MYYKNKIKIKIINFNAVNKLNKNKGIPGEILN